MWELGEQFQHPPAPLSLPGPGSWYPPARLSSQGAGRKAQAPAGRGGPQPTSGESLRALGLRRWRRGLSSGG